MNDRVWINRSHPQTLQNAQLIGYLRLVFAVVSAAVLGMRLSLIGFLFFMIVPGLGAFASYLMAQDKKIGWFLAFVPPVLDLAYKVTAVALLFDPVGTIFDVVLLYLLTHERSREYIKIWFK